MATATKTKTKLVPLDSGVIMTARNLGISLGD